MKELILDIETSQNIGTFWRPGSKVSISHHDILEERRIICVCYKWRGKKQVSSIDWGKKQCDKELLERLIPVLHDADAIVAHNGDRFDVPWLRGRVLIHGLNPIGDVNTVDTCKMANRLGLNSARLDYLHKIMGGDGKLETGGVSLWHKVLGGNISALSKMVRYCKRDVTILEQVYEWLLPHVPATYNRSLSVSGHRDGCSSCGAPPSDQVRFGIVTRRAGKYQRYQCKQCGAVWRSSRMLKL